MPDLQPVFDDLRRRLAAHEHAFLASRNFTDADTPASRRVDQHSSDSYLLLGAPTKKYPGGQMFAGVKLGKRYVSFYLTGAYVDPGLLDGASDALVRRRQGASCFNFSRVDDALFDELGDLTTRCREQYAAAGLLRG